MITAYFLLVLLRSNILYIDWIVFCPIEKAQSNLQSYIGLLWLGRFRFVGTCINWGVKCRYANYWQDLIHQHANKLIWQSTAIQFLLCVSWYKYGGCMFLTSWPLIFIRINATTTQQYIVMLSLYFLDSDEDQWLEHWQRSLLINIPTVTSQLG